MDGNEDMQIHSLETLLNDDFELAASVYSGHALNYFMSSFKPILLHKWTPYQLAMGFQMDVVIISYQPYRTQEKS